MPTYINPHRYSIQLTGPHGEIIIIKSKEVKSLSEYYDKYRKRGFIQLVSQDQPAPPSITKKIIKSKQLLPKSQLQSQRSPKPQLQYHRPKNKIIKSILGSKATTTNKIVGKSVPAGNELNVTLSQKIYPISNNIGVGILSYNRGKSLSRLISSIINYTDLGKTTIIISDDNSTDHDTIKYLNMLQEDKRFLVLRNNERGGVATNTNRLLHCLSRFKYCMLLNDDVEILTRGWDHFYRDAMIDLDMHHFIFRQSGIYGAKEGEHINFKNRILSVVHEKPQGAILAYTNQMYKAVGDFNPIYGRYGMEHVDWSMKAWEFDLQKPGFYDVKDSDKFFLLHNEQSAVEDRNALLLEARKTFELRRVKEKHQAIIDLPALSYIIPIRNRNRTSAIETVINNVRAQKFPIIDIIVSEYDHMSYVDHDKIKPCIYHLTKSTDRDLFNKSIAFNQGVLRNKYKFMILHDADMLMPSDYTNAIYDILQQHESCHIGNRVLYTDQQSAEYINNANVVDGNVKIERIVGYFEGGSLATRSNIYWQIGGFNEDYWGYGCEDCDFYARLSGCSNFYNNRTFDLIHLWHDRTDGWNNHHAENRKLESKLRQSSLVDRIALQRIQLKQKGYL